MARKSSKNNIPIIDGAEKFLNGLVNNKLASGWMMTGYLRASPDAVRKKLGKKNLLAEYQNDTNMGMMLKLYGGNGKAYVCQQFAIYTKDPRKVIEYIISF
jgi:hypothetical protein